MLFLQRQGRRTENKNQHHGELFKDINAQQLLDDMRTKSMQYLKHRLFIKYSRNKGRPIFTGEDLWKSRGNFRLNIR